MRPQPMTISGSSSAVSKPAHSATDPREVGRRDFIVVATYAMGAVGAAAVAWPLIDQMNPAADTLALAQAAPRPAKATPSPSRAAERRGQSQPRLPSLSLAPRRPPEAPEAGG